MKPPPWQIEEAEKLRELFNARAGVSQETFGSENEIGSQGMVWQFLAGRRPLHIEAAAKFADGLNVTIADFSPRLAEKIAKISKAALSPLPSDESQLLKTYRKLDERQRSAVRLMIDALIRTPVPDGKVENAYGTARNEHSAGRRRRGKPKNTR